MIERKLPLPAYEQCIKASHTFNLLDARGVISVTERQSYILRVRDARQGLLRGVARDAASRSLPERSEGARVDGRASSRNPVRRDSGAHAGARRRRSQAPGGRRAEGRGPRLRRCARLRDAAAAGAGGRRPAGGAARRQRGAAWPAGRRARQAIQGFLKGAGLGSLDQAEKRDTGKGEFWFAVIKKKGGPTADALPGVIDAAMKALPWPKSMKWGSGTMQWVRPLQGDRRAVRRQGAAGRGRAGRRDGAGDVRRHHARPSLPEQGRRSQVTGFADYVAKLRAAHVVLDPAERKKIILEGRSTLTQQAQVALKDDEGLLDEVAGLVEWPVPLLGTIDAQFMDVPAEVLIVSMKTHLRQFVTTKADGTLANRFVVVANTVARDGGKTIVEGNERVLRARLADAKFFWDQDRKARLEERLPALKGIVFHAKLGTPGRAGAAHRGAGDRRSPTSCRAPTRPQVMMAAELCKADLVSGMVGEFPELQGIMGRYYALREKLPAAVADAIGDHYAPAGPNDRCPSAPVSIAVALADKLDALSSFWSIGEKPTGSRDPYALRRAALGVIRIVVENRLRLPLASVLRAKPTCSTSSPSASRCRCATRACGTM